MSFRKTSKSHPCPLCGRATGWPCYLFAEGKGVACKNISHGSFGQDQQGNYKHWLEPSQAYTFKPKPKVEGEIRAPLDRRDTAYNAWLGMLDLKPQHFTELHVRRGLDRATIERNGYRSMPDGVRASEIVSKLAHSHNLNQVPGFYQQGDRWRSVGMPEGILLPCRNAQGQIQALSLRRTDGREENKYLWLSSVRDEEILPGGGKSGAPVHCVNSHLFKTTKEILISEGCLKGDIVGHLTGLPLFSIAGVSNFAADFAANIKRNFPNITRAIICYDGDILTKKEVHRALVKLARQFEQASFDVRVRTWPKEFKGFDDYLLHEMNASRAERAA